MPVSAYLKAGLFVVAEAVALFAAAGTVAIPGFWAYLAIFAVVMIVSFAALDPDLLRERMRPGGKKPPLALRVFSLVLFMHWIVAGLDRGRFHWSDDVPGWLQGICLFTVGSGYALALWAMRVNQFFSSAIRIQTDRGQHVVANFQRCNWSAAAVPRFPAPIRSETGTVPTDVIRLHNRQRLDGVWHQPIQPNSQAIHRTEGQSLRQMPALDVKLMTKDQDLSFQRDPRPEQ